MYTVQMSYQNIDRLTMFDAVKHHKSAWQLRNLRGYKTHIAAGQNRDPLIHGRLTFPGVHSVHVWWSTRVSRFDPLPYKLSVGFFPVTLLLPEQSTNAKCSGAPPRNSPA